MFDQIDSVPRYEQTVFRNQLNLLMPFDRSLRNSAGVRLGFTHLDTVAQDNY